MAVAGPERSGRIITRTTDGPFRPSLPPSDCRLAPSAPDDLEIRARARPVAPVAGVRLGAGDCLFHGRGVRPRSLESRRTLFVRDHLGDAAGPSVADTAHRRAAIRGKAAARLLARGC